MTVYGALKVLFWLAIATGVAPLLYAAAMGLGLQKQRDEDDDILKKGD